MFHMKDATRMENEISFNSIYVHTCTSPPTVGCLITLSSLHLYVWRLYGKVLVYKAFPQSRFRGEWSWAREQRRCVWRRMYGKWDGMGCNAV
jgi:hypothetical protein